MAKNEGEIYKDGRSIAEIDENGNITNNHGEYIGEIDADGYIFHNGTYYRDDELDEIDFDD